MKNAASKKQLREFGLLLGIGFPFMVNWIMHLISGHTFRVWSLWIGISIFILGIIKPSLLFYPYKTWMRIGIALGWINSRIILGFIFLMVVQPIALIMKLFSHDPLRRSKTNTKTYRETNKDHKVNLKRIF